MANLIINLVQDERNNLDSPLNSDYSVNKYVLIVFDIEIKLYTEVDHCCLEIQRRSSKTITSRRYTQNKNILMKAGPTLSLILYVLS